LTGKPRAVDDLERRIAALERERDAVERDRWIGIDTGAERMGTVTSTLAELTAELATMTDRWARERALVDQILAVRLALHARATEEMETAELETAERDLERAMGLETPLPLSTEATDGSPVGPDGTETALGDLLRELEDLTAGSPLLHYEVCPETIGAVISDWTGVPMGRMVRDESALLGRLDQALADRIRGQDGALSAIHRGILTAKARLGNPASPMGVFLLAGPSGVGKTETALALADLLFGGERFMITVNMSEFQEKHSVARLIGSPPGYVGYGEGGVLTEAVRQRPYSVVLLDEIEKADLEVMNLFYQVFDKGTLADGEGREIDFRNTVILMTTNLASREITDLVEGGERNPETIKAAITPLMAARLKPALLARMTLVPYFPLVDAVLADVARMKLNRLGDRLREHHGLAFTYTEEVVQAILARCDDVDTGARAVDHILTGDLSPQIAGEILKRMDRENRPTRLVVTLTEQGRFNLDFGDGDDQDPAPLSSSGLVLADE
jgi:type VI secretion system protein VasG